MMDPNLDSEEVERRVEKLQEISLLHLDDYDISSEDNLYSEKGIIHNFLEAIDEMGMQDENENVKSSYRSNQLRIHGNRLFNDMIHDRTLHLWISQLYNESIAVAPRESEELALGFGSRSAFLLHWKRYQDCINDCDRALQITSISQLKLKLLHRKVLCLVALKDKNAKRVYDEALSFLKTCTLDKKRKREFRDKFADMSHSISEMTFDEKIKEEKHIIDKELPSFKPNKEASCASDAVAIAHHEIWGRHIIAERDIEPGEIIVVEENYLSFLDPTKMYAFCSTCMKPSLCLIPCNNCIYDVYCSEECKSEAWKKYHQFECPIYSHLGNGKSEVKLLFFYLRFMLVLVYNAGGMDNLREELIAVAKCQDVRKKGFMDDGKFYSDQARSCLCIRSANNWGDSDEITVTSFANKTCYTVYYLATKTELFGEMFDLTPSQIIHQPHMMLFAGLLLKCFFSLSNNKLILHVHTWKYESLAIAASIWPFSCMFNHSCSPNADHFVTENKELAIYAKEPIKKGSQIFINYYDLHFLSWPREDRQRYMEEWYSFQCECIPCQNKWSDVCLPSLKDLLNTTPELAAEINSVIDKNNQVIKQLFTENFVYKKEILEKIAEILKVIDEKVTVCCKEYVYYQSLMRKMFIMTFAMKIDIPECESEK
ncbi:SET and MYND domain-containing protein 4 [Nasonia vitripennis]|uniref:SET and MYND domain-containing protein 4 n=1 Tax=Nasonia vitripennis TaxID=7425 RepID=A0A7M7LKG3_NASVI|nr:SET and MYND domain-containing protein 4 [Nasonia vitripennis]XP_003424586.1 SET and MYND domain-containing protein 4 [Nasonia vitripennis]